MTQPAYHDRVLSFAELANRFSKKNLDSLSREEVIEICNKAISDANISAVFENAFAMDCETLNQLQRDAKSQYGEDFYMAPGSEYLSNEDGTGKWNVTQWEHLRSKRATGTTVLIKADWDLVKKKTRSLLVRAAKDEINIDNI